VEADRGWRQGMGASVAAPRLHHRRTAGRRPRDLSRRIGPFGRRRHDRPLHRPPRPLSVGGVSKWGVSDCRVVLSKLAMDLYTPLCTSLCFDTLFSAMVFTVCSCSVSVYICLLFLCLAFSLQGGQAGGGSGPSCHSLHRLPAHVNFHLLDCT